MREQEPTISSGRSDGEFGSKVLESIEGPSEQSETTPKNYEEFRDGCVLGLFATMCPDVDTSDEALLLLDEEEFISRCEIASKGPVDQLCSFCKSQKYLGADTGDAVPELSRLGVVSSQTAVGKNMGDALENAELLATAGRYSANYVALGLREYVKNLEHVLRKDFESKTSGRSETLAAIKEITAITEEWGKQIPVHKVSADELLADLEGN